MVFRLGREIRKFFYHKLNSDTVTIALGLGLERRSHSAASRSRFVFSPKKVTVRGLGVVKPKQQLESLIDWLGKMKGALPDAKV
jgi:hypothetical protein